MEAKHSKVTSCVLLDIQMPDLNGLALQEEMTRRGIQIPIVFISGHGNIPITVRTMKAGAVDFLSKPVDGKSLFAANAQAIAKIKIQKKKEDERARVYRRIKTLSPRELEVFLMVVKGMLSKQIAFKRGTALQTIKVHRGRVMKKMKVTTVTDLIRLAEKAGLVTPKRL